MFSCALWAQAPATSPAKPAISKPKPAVAAPAPAAGKPSAPAAKPFAGDPAKPSTTAANDPVILTIGDESITQSQFEGILKAMPANAQAQLSSPAGKRQFAERLGEIKAMAQEARRRKLDQKQSVKTQLKLTEDNLLASSLYQDLLDASKPSDADIQKYYDEHKADYESAEARHILVRFKGSRVPLKDGQKDLSEEEALARTKELRDRIVKGEDFATVAKAESDDTGSGAQGGSLGEFGRGRMVPVFEEAAFTQPVGQVSEPVKSPFGYHLIQVQKRGVKPLAEVREEIEEQQKPEGARKVVEALTANTKTVLNDSYFGKEPAAPPTPPQPGQPAARPQPGQPAKPPVE